MLKKHQSKQKLNLPNYTMHPQNKLVSFFGLGSPTAAKLLYSYIKEHPNSYVPAGETNFFSDIKKFALGLAWYEDHFSNAAKTQICGELTYNYLSSSQTAALIARTYPSARLLAVIENPLVSVRVEYVEARRARRISPTTTLAAFLKDNPEVLLRARYGRQLVHYFSYYSHNDFLVLLAKDIREESLKTVAATYEHLGLTTEFVPLSLRHLVPEEEEDPKKRPWFLKRWIKALYKVGKRQMTKLMQRLNPPKVELETAAMLALKIPLSPELEAFLHDYFKEDVTKLSGLLHRNLLVEWGFETLN